MKKTDTKSPSSRVPRLNSLLHRLQKAPGQEDESYLDQLMIFLDNPPDDADVVLRVQPQQRQGAHVLALSSRGLR